MKRQSVKKIYSDMDEVLENDHPSQATVDRWTDALRHGRSQWRREGCWSPGR